MANSKSFPLGSVVDLTLEYFLNWLYMDDVMMFFSDIMLALLLVASTEPEYAYEYLVMLSQLCKNIVPFLIVLNDGAWNWEK